MSAKLLHSVREMQKHFLHGGIKYCLVGGLAVSARVGERTTKDIDFAISVSTESEAENIVKYLISCGLKVDSLLEHKQTKKLCTVRLKFVEGPKYYIDLLFSASGVEAEVVRTSTELELLPDFFLPVATVPSLLAMKLVSVDADRRPNDVADINTLITSLNSEEYAETIVLLETITKRGLNRGRDLKGMLEDRVRLLKE